jgi:predicted transcriptional regulator of viral defense system
VIVSGAVRVTFIVRKNIDSIPVQNFNTPRGTVRVSTPEATAVDLVGYPAHIGGLDQAATILSELAEKLDSEKLAIAAQNAPMPWAQRLGYLLERFGESDRAGALKSYVQKTRDKPQSCCRSRK